mmetsp:Transcript_4312/g.6400  ORF Transcript_4312/g.6400 Transcript_4312/m.6400 type:complete len:411 (+) Transcript_4312:146-1378(+)|eukprot:CAMPEP_0202446536 /NCGR_PEP_ID=MMETSP1360-20130828/5035_1 /ASSEMBLY_ACC=CAM_ASM_000848 /TAXON_ID=515479 /ORGANISM="Licmophora paradoxa, Strain CCMP2313" /LENGTH=410 /DNA_ID=CAMNT_0049063061 /DNA_START=108 /DNA_END=1340 /DNA_ORIENTATION=+
MEVTESISKELLSLIGFASRLGTTVCSDDNASSQSSASSNEIGEEAQLLMDFCNSGAFTLEEKKHVNNSNAPTKVTKPVVTTGEKLNHEFSFTCPSLSLSQANPTEPAPATLLGRELTIKSRNGIRLNSEAMALNLLKSFQQALDWRREIWIGSLQHSLAGKELAAGNRWRELMGSPEARVLKTLLEMSSPHVVEARTSFKVSKHRWQASGLKKVPHITDPVAHVLSFQCVMALITPAGYSQVTLEAPGIIEGTWDANGALKRVHLQLDTQVLSKIMEQACRFLVRASAESFLGPTDMHHSSLEDAPSVSAISSDTDESLVYNTPQRTSVPEITASDSAWVPLPSYFDEARLVSPQPQGSFSPPLLPRKTYGTIPLVSPPPRNEEYFSSEEAGPSLPALVEVACAAMKSR